MNRPSERDKVSFAFEDIANSWARDLEDREARRVGSLPAARKALARKTGIAAGTFENLRKGRLKGVKGWIVERLRSAVIKELTLEIERCAHAIQVARQVGVDPRSDEMAALESAMCRAKELMGVDPK